MLTGPGPAIFLAVVLMSLCGTYLSIILYIVCLSGKFALEYESPLNTDRRPKLWSLLRRSTRLPRLLGPIVCPTSL